MGKLINYSCLIPSNLVCSNRLLTSGWWRYSRKPVCFQLYTILHELILTPYRTTSLTGLCPSAGVRSSVGQRSSHISILCSSSRFSFIVAVVISNVAPSNTERIGNVTVRLSSTSLSLVSTRILTPSNYTAWLNIQILLRKLC